ncbi:MAG TPA: PQQ-binding-like beta-propeller repeat protein [Armatimonadota bacterium]
MKLSVRWDDIVIPVIAMALLAGGARASGTLAGTVLSSQAVVSYSDGAPKSAVSSPVAISVGKRASLKLTLKKNAETISGLKAIPCSVVNDGNYAEDIRVLLAYTGCAVATVIQDTNGNGKADAAETTQVSVLSQLPADQTADCLLMVLPATGAKIGDTGNITVQALCADEFSTLTSAKLSATLARPLPTKFAYDAGEALCSSPIVTRGLAITGSESGVVYAVHATGKSIGQLAWRFPVKGNVGGAIRGRVATDGSSFFFTANNGYAYCLKADGSQLWSSQVAAANVDLEAMPIISANSVSVACGDGRIRSLDKATGAMLAGSPPMGGGGLSTPSMPQLSDMWVGGADGSLYNLKGDASFTVLSAISVSVKPLTSTPFVDVRTGLVLSATQEGNAFALRSRSNEIIWGPKSLGSPVMGSPWVDSRAGSVFFGGSDAAVYGLKVADGSTVPGYPVKMTCDDGGFVNSPVVAPLSDGHAVLFAASTGGRVYGLDTANPAAVAQFDANDPDAGFVGSPALSGASANDVLVAAGRNGKLYGFRVGDALGL